jgi:hypothetical protein
VVRVPLRADASHDLPAMLATSKQQPVACSTSATRTTRPAR